MTTPGGDVADRAGRLLRDLVGDPTADFRDGQLDAIRRVHEHRAKALVVQRTGWGKSAVYFVATALNREEGRGPTLIVSPLLALMRNQLDAADRIGIRSETVNSTNPGAWGAIFGRIAAGDVDLLLISPERLNNPAFRQQVLDDLLGRIGLLVVDEAHCISDWGHDFRPDYRRISRVVQSLPPRTPVLLTTATANQRVVDDVVGQLGADLRVIRGTLDRESLRLDALDLPSKPERMAWVAEAVGRLPGSGIVYCLTVADANHLAGFLADEGIDAVAYTGQTDEAARLDVEARLSADTVKVVVATSALGMGYDNPHLRWVIHFQDPGSPVAYYQQVGRAGRAVDDAVGVLLSGTEDADIQDHFIRTAFPTEPQAREILDALAGADGGLRLGDLLTAVNLQRGRLEGFLKQLEVDGYVERADGRWARTQEPFTYPAERVEGVTAQRRHEQARMRQYLTTGTCLLRFLRDELDDPDAEACGRCARCVGAPLLDHQPDPDVTLRAEAFLGRLHPPILPRLRWVAGVDRSRLPDLPANANAAGVALTRSGSPVWGRRIRDGKQRHGTFDEALVEQLARVVGEHLPLGGIRFVTHVPSVDGDLVADFARRLAARLDRPHLDLLAAHPGPPQAAMYNSEQQAMNAIGRFSLAGFPPEGAGLLVDDTVDSRWTLTVCGALLREAGATAIHPAVLADASPA